MNNGTAENSNPEMLLANNFVQFTGKNIFLTGKAGTGKTTFLHKLKNNTPKRMIVIAPTGVAAINAGGVTLHSFFQMPFGPYVPGNEIQRQTEQKASRYFFDNLQTDLLPWVDFFGFDSDNKEVRKQINKTFTWLQHDLAIKKQPLCKVAAAAFPPVPTCTLWPMRKSISARPRPPVSNRWVLMPEIFNTRNCSRP